ncbi:hypothetical protein PQQ52_30370 [Paraburkholderia sediminicola]
MSPGWPNERVHVHVVDIDLAYPAQVLNSGAAVSSELEFVDDGDGIEF